jgi:hypothetical protein
MRKECYVFVVMIQSLYIVIEKKDVYVIELQVLNILDYHCECEFNPCRLFFFKATPL